MSPGVVQRGSLALMPAEVRAEAALSCGADVVLCLPAPYAAASAEAFAAAGVRALSALGCVRRCATAQRRRTPPRICVRQRPCWARPLRGICAKGLPGACPLAAAAEGCAGRVRGGGRLWQARTIFWAWNTARLSRCKKAHLQPLALSAPGRRTRRPTGQRAGGCRCAGTQTFSSLRGAAGWVCQRHGPASPCGAAWPAALEPYVPRKALALYLRAQRQGGRCWTKKAFPRPFYAA